MTEAKVPVIELRIPRFLEGPWLEEQHALVAQTRPDELLIDVGGWDASRLMADARLLGLLIDARRHGCVITLHTGQAPLVSRNRRGTNRMWRQFTGSPAGLVLAQMADEVLDSTGHPRRDEIRSVQAEVAGASERLGWGTGHERALVSVTRIGGPAPDPPLDQRTPYSVFAGKFRSLSGHVFAQQMGGAHMVAISRFAAEALSNTAQHGTTDWEGGRLEGVRFLLLRRLSLVQEGTSAELHSASSVIDRYLSRARDWLEHGAAKTHLAELTIADSGLGIAGRLGGREVYAGSIQRELDFLRLAMEPRSTSKANSEPNAGMGLDKMLTSARELGGLVIFRSGRLELRYDGLAAEHGSTAPWTNEERTPIAGTAISFLFPWHDRTQLQMPLGTPR